MKDGNSCRAPEDNMYADSNGDEHRCTSSITNVRVLGGQTEQVARPGECPFTCQSGYIPRGRFCIKPLAAGEKHTCAILNNGNLKCWGWNDYGQLGLGNTTEYNSPQAVDLGASKTAKVITASWNYTCAILNDDTLKCWGDNEYGQLGLGNHGTGTERTAPEVVNLGSGKTAKVVSAGGATGAAARGAHTCAILNDDSLKCWGWNTKGQLGLGNRTEYNSPQAVDLGTGKTAKAVSTRDIFTPVLF